MKTRFWSLIAGLLGLAVFLVSGNGSLTGQPPALPEDGEAVPQQEDVEVLGRGPVHEAFADPVTDDPGPTPIVPKKPPAPIEEMPPDQKPEGDDVQWIPGYFAWDDDKADFLWVSGFWRTPPPDHTWMPGRWRSVEGGWQWVAGFWATTEQTDVEYLPPPPESIEAGPSTPPPQPDSTYVPGCWVYRDTRYLWRPGTWVAYRPDWMWSPARYCWTPGGYIFVEGFWDYLLPRRGLLFAPVYFHNRVWARPNWYYQPRYVVPHTTLVTSLFVRPSFGHYYFGDYFETTYRKRGYVAWVDYRVGRQQVPDPIFAHYRARYHREQPTWEKEVRTVYEERRLGNLPRPPRTLVEQNQVIKNITVNKTVKTVNKTIEVTNVNNVINNVTVVAPLNKVDRSLVKLRPVPPAKRAEELKVVKEFRAVSQERRKVESLVLAKGAASKTPTAAPRPVKAELRRVVTPAVKEVARIKAPPPPTLPNHEEKPIPKREVKPPPRVEVKPPPRVDPREIKPPPKVDPRDIKPPRVKKKK